jgi:hypothetical protein
MGELYNCFKENKKQTERFVDKVGLVRFTHGRKRYQIFFTRKRANRYSIIHCENNTVEWEQFPILPRIAGRLYGKREPVISLRPSKDYITIFVIMGKPRSITGLDEGDFRSVHKFDGKLINVMSEARFKEL